jgi:hypothetical protein
MQDDLMLKALAAGARAFAEAVEDGLRGAEAADPSLVPVPGSPESMRILLRRVADVNQGQSRGATQQELSSFAREAGMDPRGTAGYYREGPSALLENRSDGRWITDTGVKRLETLETA